MVAVVEYNPLHLCFWIVGLWEILVASGQNWKREDLFFKVSTGIFYILVGIIVVHPLFPQPKVETY